MPIEINKVTFYSPGETAELLGTNVGMVRYYRHAGYIQGTSMGTSTYYTMEQIEAARKKIAEPKKRGPKKRDKDEEEGSTSSVTYAFSSQVPVALGATA